MKWKPLRDRFMPFSGLALGTLGAGLAHQVGSDTTFQNCELGSPSIVTLAAISGLLLVAFGALGSWRVYSADREAPARRMIATISLMACGLYALAIVLPLIAAMVIPRCWA